MYSLDSSWAQNGLANAEHSCLDNSVCCHSLEYQNHSCQSKRVWLHVHTFSWCIQIMGTKSVCLSVCVRHLNPGLWGFCKYCAIVEICNTSLIHPSNPFIHPSIWSIHPSNPIHPSIIHTAVQKFGVGKVYRLIVFPSR